jgi:hypothetical protein
VRRSTDETADARGWKEGLTSSSPGQVNNLKRPHMQTAPRRSLSASAYGTAARAGRVAEACCRKDLAGLTDWRFTCAAKARVATAARRTACLHVSRAMQAARRRADYDFTSRLGRRAEAGPRQVLARVGQPIEVR